MENCINWQERISAFLDGALTEQERMELMEHLESCVDCRGYFDDQVAIHGALTDLEAAAPAGFAETVMERVRETAQDAPEKKVIAFPHWRRWAATAACCAVVLLGVLGLGSAGRNDEAMISQNVVGYSVLTRGQMESAADCAAVTEAPAEMPKTTAPCATMESADLAPTADAATENKAQAAYASLTTSSPLAEQWVTEQLGETWQAGSSYELTEAQFKTLWALLESAGESCTVEYTEASGFWLRAE